MIPLIPAKAGIQGQIAKPESFALDPRFRGGERSVVLSTLNSHGRTCSGHPRLTDLQCRKSWMPATRLRSLRELQRGKQARA